MVFNHEKLETSQEEVKVFLDACQDKTKVNPEKTKAGLEEMEVVAGHLNVHKEASV
jgi:hypothetical protein